MKAALYSGLLLALSLDYYLDLMDRSHALYQRGLIDRPVLTLVLQPRGTTLNYWWLPQWRSRFLRDAPGIFDDAHVNQILRGEHWFDYPGRGYWLSPVRRQRKARQWAGFSVGMNYLNNSAWLPRSTKVTSPARATS